MTDLLTVQKMHSFRPVFAFPPCAPHPGHRSTPVTLDDWIHIALVGCHVPASAFQSTAAVHPTGTFLTGSDAIAANNCASAYEQTAIRARTPPGGGIGTRRIFNLHALVTINASFISYIVEINTHSRTFWQRAHPSIRKRGPQAPFFSNYAYNGSYILRNLRVRCRNCACGAGHQQPRCCNYARNGGYIRQSHRVRYGNRNRSTSRRSPASLTSP